MENFYQITIHDLFMDREFPAIRLSSKKANVLCRESYSIGICKEKQERIFEADLFGLKLDVIFERGYEVMTPEEDDKKLYVYYVVSGIDHTGKFIGSYKKYSELPENPVLVWANHSGDIQEIKLEKKNLIEIDESNFHRAVQVTYNLCFTINNYENFILCEYRNIARVTRCDILIDYPNNKVLGLNRWLFNEIPLMYRKESHAHLDMNYRDIYRASKCEKLSKNVTSFYSEFLYFIEIPEHFVYFIKEETPYTRGMEWKYSYSLE